jgi:flavin-dependent dehydrogenase
MAQLYDVAILGATPAGCAAAWALAEAGRSVVVVDAPRDVVECPLSDWVGKSFFAMKGLPKSLKTQVGAQPFKKVHYHSADLQRHAQHASRSAAGYFLDSNRLISVLKDAARSAGTTFRSTRAFPAISLEEDQIRLIGTSQTRAKLLLIAQGRPTEVIEDLALPIRTVPLSSLVVAALDVPLGRSQAKEHAGILHVVESREQTEMGLFFILGQTLHLRVVSSSSASGSRAAELSEMVSELKQAGLLPEDLGLNKARGAVWRPPAGVALELETHVTKRCLLIGTAGGFVEAVNGQTLTSSVRSGFLAAEVAGEALDADGSQDALMRFKDSWRRSLAEFLRPPNTSLRMLLPLMFVNQQIVGRFSAALLDGKNI